MTTEQTPPVLRILLADDNDANRLIARTIMERAGHKVTTAKNGSHALSLAKISNFDLIVLDIMMPVMDGMRAMRRLRRDKTSNRDTPVFALTAYCSAEDRQRYFLAGFDNVLSKPLRPGDIEQAYKSHSDKSLMPAVQRLSVTVECFDTVPLLDAQVIDLLSTVGSDERRASIQSRFWTSIELHCDTMKRALPDALRGDGPFLSQFRRAVHSVKGASATIGLSRVADIARRLQNAPPNEIPHLMRALADALTESRPALTEALSGANLLRPGQFDTAV